MSCAVWVARPTAPAAPPHLPPPFCLCTSCLALAELARRGLLLPSRLPSVVPVVTQALTYDVRRGLHSVGAHVRDAACYVCWAFARAYAPAVMHAHVQSLATGMMVTACLDREINCRRAASAAFQESVGRQGHENFPNGITVLTAADYFTLGNRKNAYTVVAPFVAQFKEYRLAMLDHLVNVKLCHWDVDMRLLAAQALAAMVPRDPNHLATVTIPRLLELCLSRALAVRHGAILGVAEVIAALAAHTTAAAAAATAATEEAGEGKESEPSGMGAAPLTGVIAPSAVATLRGLVPAIEKNRLYRGRGGEYVRGAVCRLIECLATSGIPLKRSLVTRLQDTLDDCLKHPHDTIQEAAAAAFKALAAAHMAVAGDAALLERVPRKHAAILERGAKELPATRRGAALLLGALPRALLLPARAPDGAGSAEGAEETPGGGGGGVAATSPDLQRVLDALIGATRVEKRPDARDAETRRNAVASLAQLATTMGIDATAAKGGITTAAQSSR